MIAGIAGAVVVGILGTALTITTLGILLTTTILGTDLGVGIMAGA